MSSRPSQRSHAPLPTGVLAFLLTDIEGSMRRWEAWPHAMRGALVKHDAALRAAIVGAGGHIFKTGGDAFFAAFASPDAAIRAALDAQNGLALADFSEVGGLPVRMAIHAGPAEAREGDYFGQGVNRCARLLSLAYGGQILVSDSAADMSLGALPAEAGFIDLGRHRLKDVAEPKQIFQLSAPGLRIAFPALRSDGAKIHNLSKQLTSYVRRDEAVGEIKARLERNRLVTLVGSGGAGKTRMAIEVGWDLLEGAYEGVWIVELASLDDPRLVAETLCAAIGAPIGIGATALESAIAFLKPKRALVILDNCEHLIDGAARVVDALMARCASLSLLCTSREALEIPGESAYRVPSLSVPILDRDIGAAEALKHDAVRLFVDRASAAIAGFQLTDANAAAVANICRHLDGLPMAIELAVPQLRMLQPKALDAKLRDRFLLLVKGARTALPRHQTLATIFDWSHNLLGPEERVLFRRLSVFADGWTLEAAIAVAGDDKMGSDAIFAALSGLVAKSLVVAELASADPRYRFLRTTRQYAAEKLHESGETDLRAKLARAMISIFADACAKWSTMATEDWLALYEPDLDNLRACLDWAFGPEGDSRLGVELASHSLRIWDELSLLAERERWFTTALERADATTEPTALARLHLGRTSNSAHGDRANFELARRASEAFAAADQRLWLGESLARAGAALEAPDTPEPGLPFLQRAIEVLRPLGPTKQLANCLRSLGVGRYFLREFEEARALVSESEAVARRIGDGRGVAQAQIAAAELEFAAGNAAAAIERARELLSGHHYNRRQLTLCLGNLAAYKLALDRVPEAKANALEGLKEARALLWRAAVARVVEHLALVAALTGKTALSAQLFGYVVAFYAEGGATREFTELSTYNRVRDALAEHLSEGEIGAHMATGAKWTEDRCVEQAMTV